MTINKSIDDPYITLSKKILITKYSNPLILHNFLINKIDRTDESFEFGELQYYWLTLKYKSIELDFNYYTKFISK